MTLRSCSFPVSIHFVTSSVVSEVEHELKAEWRGSTSGGSYPQNPWFANPQFHCSGTFGFSRSATSRFIVAVVFPPIQLFDVLPWLLSQSRILAL